MALVSPTQITFDIPAVNFRLPATDGRTYSLNDVAGEKGTVIVFICNHCPYVRAMSDRLVADARALMQEGIGFALICSNDAENYPENSFDNMKQFAKAHEFPFPYLHDEAQSVARAYGAVCTPDLFGYGADRSSNIVVASMRAARPRLLQAHAANSSRPCAPSRRRTKLPRIKLRRWAARSNGSRYPSPSLDYSANVLR